MDTIKNYLDNVFMSLPNTPEIMKLKEELLSNLEDKYNELKNSGKTENEAIGIVISEFGNIDELIKGFNIDMKEKTNAIHTLSLNEAEEFLKDKKKYGTLIALGVFLCILAPAALIFVEQFITSKVSILDFSQYDFHQLSVIPLFVLIAIAVGLFIYCNSKLEKYKYLEELFDIPLNVKISIQNKKETFASNYTTSIIIGVILCVLSPLPLIILSAIDKNNSNFENYGAITLLLLVAIAVFMFVRVGNINDSYNVLLQIKEYSKKNKNDRVINTVSSIVWPIATVIFLIWGLVFHGWGICWIVYPVTGVLFGGFSAAYNTLKQSNNK